MNFLCVPCCRSDPKKETKTVAAEGTGAASAHQRQLSIQDNIVRIQTLNSVHDKYEIMDEIGVGSMGSIYKVRIKQNKLGGSAFFPKTKTPKESKIKRFLSRKSKSDPVEALTLQQQLLYQQQQQQEHLQMSALNGIDNDRSNCKRYTYALKTIRLDQFEDSYECYLDEMKNEMDILRLMDHPNIVKAHEVFISNAGATTDDASGTKRTHQQMCIVLELCVGGDLYDRLPYTEREAARIIEKVLNAVGYMHERGIVHRDLKFENIMFLDDSPTAEIKILDFGLSKKFRQSGGSHHAKASSRKSGYMSERVGTIYTMSPEVLDGVYTSQADLWSIGVISYMLLSSKKPFHHKKMDVMIDLIYKGNPSFDDEVWNTISNDAKDFVRNLLLVDPDQRLTIQQALKHPFIVRRELLSDELPSAEVYKMIEYGLMNYTMNTSKLKKLALTVIAHDSTSQDVEQLRKAFTQFDTERNGILSLDEFKSALMQNIQHKYTEDELESIFRGMDINCNGMIMYTEFLAATIEACGRIEEDRIAEAFDRLDSDDTGFISKENLREVLGVNCTENEVNAIMSASDKDGDGKISYADFLESFREQTNYKAQQVSSEPMESITEV